MSRQPVKPALDAEVETRLARLWTAPADRDTARALLERYGEAGFENEVARVQLALLKLTEGRLERLAELVRAAKTDYRDVLMWAEYPEQARAGWSVKAELTPAERRELSAIRARDRRHYEKWRKG